MKSLRKTLKYAFAILLLLGCGAGAVGVWWWQHSDEWLLEMVQKKFDEDAPGWNITVARCRFDFIRTIYIDGLKIQGDETTGTISSIPKIQVVVDRETLADQRKVAVHKISVRNPHLNVVQNIDGSWNVLNLPPLRKSTQPLPEWEIDNGSIAVQICHPDGTRPEAVLVNNVEMSLIPSGKRQFLVDGSGTISGIGRVSINGRWEVDPKTWSINATLPNLQINSLLLGRLSEISPAFAAALVRAKGELSSRSQSGLARNQQRDPFLSQATTSKSSNAEFDLAAVGDVNLRLTRWQQEADLEYKFLLNLQHGHLRHQHIPYQIDNVAGKIYADNRDVIVRNLTLHERATRLSVNARLRHHTSTPNGRVELSVAQLPCDARFREQLNVRLKSAYDLIEPQGTIDGSVTLEQNSDRTWSYSNLFVATQDAQAVHQKFPYPISKIAGTMKQSGNDLQLDFQGMAGTRPVELKGIIHDAGNYGSTQYDIRVDGLPIDSTFIAALPPEVATTIQQLNLSGVSDLYLRLTRPSGPDGEYTTDIAAHVRNGTIRYEHFPYRLRNVSGKVMAAGGDWSFSELKGTHDGGSIQGAGTLSTRSGVSELSLDLTAKDLPLDESLRIALPEQWKTTWKRIAPVGHADISTQIRWRKGDPVAIVLPSVRIHEGQILLADFPYPILAIEADLSIDSSGFTLRSFSGRHDDTAITAAGFYQNVGREQWRLRLTEFSAANLVADRSLLRALPDQLDNVALCVDSEHPFDLTGMIEFRGLYDNQNSLTAAWDLKTTFRNGLLHCGLDYDKLYGDVEARGTWDGENSLLEGQLNFERANILGYDFESLRGPISVKNGLLILGSSRNLLPRKKDEAAPVIPLEEHVTARAIEGVFTADLAVQLDETPVYDCMLTMSHGKLEEYARLYLEDTADLLGIMNGWLVLHGVGTEEENVFGRGQLQISPAALYELPVIAQLYNVLRLAPTSKTAFTYALFDFVIGERKFTFNSIDLVGNTFSMRGRGTADFDKNLSLDFYSMMPRAQIPIPLLSQFVDQATKAWVGVEVRGKVDTPIAKTKAVPHLDGALKQFLSAVEKGPGRGIPPLLPPRQPQSRRPALPKR